METASTERMAQVEWGTKRGLTGAVDQAGSFLDLHGLTEKGLEKKGKPGASGARERLAYASDRRNALNNDINFKQPLIQMTLDAATLRHKGLQGLTFENFNQSMENEDFAKSWDAFAQTNSDEARQIVEVVGLLGEQRMIESRITEEIYRRRVLLQENEKLVTTTVSLMDKQLAMLTRMGLLSTGVGGMQSRTYGAISGSATFLSEQRDIIQRQYDDKETRTTEDRKRGAAMMANATSNLGAGVIPAFQKLMDDEPELMERWNEQSFKDLRRTNPEGWQKELEKNKNGKWGKAKQTYAEIQLAGKSIGGLGHQAMRSLSNYGQGEELIESAVQGQEDMIKMEHELVAIADKLWTLTGGVVDTWEKGVKQAESLVSQRKEILDMAKRQLDLEARIQAYSGNINPGMLRGRFAEYVLQAKVLEGLYGSASGIATTALSEDNKGEAKENMLGVLSKIKDDPLITASEKEEIEGLEQAINDAGDDTNLLALAFEKVRMKAGLLGLEAKAMSADIQDAMIGAVNATYATEEGIKDIEVQKFAAMTSMLDNLGAGLGAHYNVRMGHMKAIQGQIDIQDQKYGDMLDKIKESTDGSLDQRKAQEALAKIELRRLQLNTQLFQVGRQLRDAWIEAVSAMSIATGRYTKIMIDAKTATGWGLKMGGMLTSFASGNVDEKFGDKASRYGSRWTATAGGGLGLDNPGDGGPSYQVGYGPPPAVVTELFNRLREEADQISLGSIDVGQLRQVQDAIAQAMMQGFEDQGALKAHVFTALGGEAFFANAVGGQKVISDQVDFVNRNLASGRTHGGVSSAGFRPGNADAARLALEGAANSSGTAGQGNILKSILDEIIKIKNILLGGGSGTGGSPSAPGADTPGAPAPTATDTPTAPDASTPGAPDPTTTPAATPDEGAGTDTEPGGTASTSGWKKRVFDRKLKAAQERVKNNPNDSQAAAELAMLTATGERNGWIDKASQEESFAASLTAAEKAVAANPNDIQAQAQLDMLKSKGRKQGFIQETPEEAWSREWNAALRAQTAAEKSGGNSDMEYWNQERLWQKGYDEGFMEDTSKQYSDEENKNRYFGAAAIMGTQIDAITAQLANESANYSPEQRAALETALRDRQAKQGLVLSKMNQLGYREEYEEKVDSGTLAGNSNYYSEDGYFPSDLQASLKESPLSGLSSDDMNIRIFNTTINVDSTSASLGEMLGDELVVALEEESVLGTRR